MTTFKKWMKVNLFLFVLLNVSLVVLSLYGSPVISLKTLITKSDPILYDVFFYVRLPRLILGALVGACLSMSGVTFQSLLRNPLADPYILGVSGGAALGGVVALAFKLPYPFVMLFSFLLALASLFFIYYTARVKGRLPAHTLLLTGVIFNAFAFALILLINAVVGMGESHEIMYLLMGSLEAQNYQSVFWVGILTCIGFIILQSNSGNMNLVSLGDDEALTLGLDVNRHRKILFFAASLIVGASVSVSGLIGFVGLFVPHFIRLLFGSDHRILMTASAIGGGLFLIICDFAAKSLLVNESFQTQLPVGVVTALIGGPFFVFLLKRGQKNA